MHIEFVMHFCTLIKVENQKYEQGLKKKEGTRGTSYSTKVKCVRMKLLLGSKIPHKMPDFIFALIVVADFSSVKINKTTFYRNHWLLSEKEEGSGELYWLAEFI